jgi:hypothetical protein
MIGTLRKAGGRAFEYSGLSRWRARRKSAGMQDSVFIWIPKNAGSSFFELYNRLGEAPKCKTPHLVKYHFAQRGHVTFGHMSYADLVRSGYISSRFDRSAYKFCFSRNPFSRAVSLYFYLHGHNPEFTFLEFCRSLHKEGAYPIGLYNRRKNSQCNPQVRWIETMDLDFIGQIENISTDIERIMPAIGLEVDTIRLLNTTTHDPYSEYYCQESRDIILDFYAQDFRYFGYSRELGTRERIEPL